jgi:hypothetical protein
VNAGGATSGPVALGSLLHGFALVTDDCTGQLLPGGGTCSFTANIHAGADDVGLVASPLAVTAQPGGTANMSLQADVHAIGTLSVTPIDFGSVGVYFGTPADQTATVTNVGEKPATVTSVYVNYLFRLVGETCSGKTLPPGGTCTVTVNVDSPWGASEQGTLIVSVNVGHSGSATLHYTGYVDGYEVIAGVEGGSAAGTVTSSDGQTCASSSCTFKFHLSSYSTLLTAQPATGFAFSYWDDSYACGYSSNPLCNVSFSMSSPTTVATARFVASP